METVELKSAIIGLKKDNLEGCRLWKELVKRLIDIYEMENSVKSVNYWTNKLNQY